jgi:hypothetical protein
MRLQRAAELAVQNAQGTVGGVQVTTGHFAGGCHGTKRPTYAGTEKGHPGA